MAPAPQPTVTTHNDFGTVNVVETPTSPSSAFTLSRFEFETGTKGNEGTKILMIEWDAAAALSAENGSADGDDQDPKPTRASLDDWEVKWEGKEGITIPPIRDPETPASSCRIYFLLPPGAPIPTLVTISHRSSGAAPDTAPHTVPHTVPHPNPEEDHHHHHLDLHTKPLPAIFPDGLVSEDKGTRGVLHTIWAKQRLGELEAEILAEMKSNGESVGLEMALQERQWIVDHFGLQIDTSSAEAIPLAPSNLDSSSPASPRSPIGGRLGEKLKGLKLATSPSELAAAKEGELFSLITQCYSFCHESWFFLSVGERGGVVECTLANRETKKRAKSKPKNSRPWCRTLRPQASSPCRWRPGRPLAWHR